MRELVDYKFGKVRKDKRYARQVRRYVELRGSRRDFSRKSAVIFWYVNEGWCSTCVTDRSCGSPGHIIKTVSKNPHAVN